MHRCSLVGGVPSDRCRGGPGGGIFKITLGFLQFFSQLFDDGGPVFVTFITSVASTERTVVCHLYVLCLIQWWSVGVCSLFSLVGKVLR